MVSDLPGPLATVKEMSDGSCLCFIRESGAPLPTDLNVRSEGSLVILCVGDKVLGFQTIEGHPMCVRLSFRFSDNRVGK